MNVRHLIKFCLVTHFKTPLPEYLKFLERAVRIPHGLTSLQIRGKFQNKMEYEGAATEIKSICDRFNLPCIINDDAHLALKLGAAGVWLGANDMHPVLARALLGPDFFIGYSVGSAQQLQLANQFPPGTIDCIAASPIFFSKSKPDCETVLGEIGLRHIAENTEYPLIGIGGLTRHNLKEVMQWADGGAFIGAVHDDPNTGEVIPAIRTIIETSLEEKYERRPACLRR